MGEFRKACCDKCFKDFTYTYVGGRTRKYCLDCKTGRAGGQQHGYDSSRMFSWGLLPTKWFLSKAGNACRTVGREIVVVYEKGGVFWFSIPSRQESPRISEIQATSQNVRQALNWAERGTENILRSFATF